MATEARRWPVPISRSGLVHDPQRLFSSEERSVADYLAARGYDIYPISVAFHKTPDMWVSGFDMAIAVEVKSMRRGASNVTIRNWMAQMKTKPHLLFDVRGLEFSREEAERGVGRGLGAYSKHYESIRVIADDFDFTEPGGA